MRRFTDSIARQPLRGRPSASHVPGPLVVVSNRGPVNHRHEPDGSIVAVRGAGGLVAALAPLADRRRIAWVASAMSEYGTVSATWKTANSVERRTTLRVPGVT